jgi:DNA polymerase-3 subunit delta
VSGSKPRASVVLLWGEDDFLLREAATDLVGDRLATEIGAPEWQGGELQDLATPSLFGDRRALIVSDAKSLHKDAISELAGYVASPAPDSILVLTATVGERAKAPAALERIVKDAGEVREVAAPARKDLEAWVVQRARERGWELSGRAARSLIESTSESPAELASCLEQVVSAFPGEPITPELVASQFRGIGEHRTWDLCDRAFSKDLPGAIRSLRSIEEAGGDALMVLGAIASRLRDLIKVRALPERMSPADVAREAGLRFDWQARRYRRQAGSYSLERLAALHDQVTDTDRALKSGSDAEVVMPVLIAAIAG